MGNETKGFEESVKALMEANINTDHTRNLCMITGQGKAIESIVALHNEVVAGLETRINEYRGQELLFTESERECSHLRTTVMRLESERDKLNDHNKFLQENANKHHEGHRKVSNQLDDLRSLIGKLGRALKKLDTPDSNGMIAKEALALIPPDLMEYKP